VPKAAHTDGFIDGVTCCQQIRYAQRQGGTKAKQLAAKKPIAKQPAAKIKYVVSDEALVKRLPGFKNGYANVNGTRLHYVVGGSGTPLVLLPGWPQTWWQFHRVMPALAKQHRVIVVDIRGMGSSAKPAAGYDKKTMARDIYELVRQLGYERVNIAGHDIGSMVAFSFAANHPEATLKLALLDVPHPDELFSELRMLPEHGKFGAKIDASTRLPLVVCVPSGEGLPEKILAGNFSTYQDFLFDTC
jgi:pimeloyl-ACP methyl ester carboxylesterase